MNRDIKFRAWNKKDHVMFGIGNVTFSSSDNSIGNITSREDFGALKNGENSGRYTLPLDEVVLMQYTGIIDNKGVPVYEGDIVRPTDYNDDTNIPFEVTWDKSGAYLMNHDYGLDYIPLLGSDDFEIEVIGNIYETPELLEDTHNEK